MIHKSANSSPMTCLLTRHTAFLLFLVQLNWTRVDSQGVDLTPLGFMATTQHRTQGLRYLRDSTRRLDRTPRSTSLLTALWLLRRTNNLRSSRQRLAYKVIILQSCDTEGKFRKSRLPIRYPLHWHCLFTSRFLRSGMTFGSPHLPYLVCSHVTTLDTTVRSRYDSNLLTACQSILTRRICHITFSLVSHGCFSLSRALSKQSAGAC